MDTFSPQERSDIMRRVRSVNTRPEIKVRSLLHRLGYRFRLHRKDLPGNPDIVLPRYRTVVFVHGCFWHRHSGCPRATTPATRQDYWLPKFERTVNRDQENQKSLRALGWNVMIIWECETKNRCLDQLIDRFRRELQLHVHYPEATAAKLVAEDSAEYHDK